MKCSCGGEWEYLFIGLEVVKACSVCHAVNRIYGIGLIFELKDKESILFDDNGKPIIIKTKYTVSDIQKILKERGLSYEILTANQMISCFKREIGEII
jgi:hypothetical protein